MKTLFFLGICLGCILPSLTSTTNALDSISWVKSLEQAKQISAQTNRPILLHFSGDFCPPCRRLEAVVFPHPTVAKTFNENVVPVKIDVKYHQDLVKKFGIKTIPADVVMSPSGFVLMTRSSPRTSEAYIKFCQSVNQQYVGITEQQIQVGNQMRQANKSIENRSREAQGLTHSQQEKTYFVGTGDTASSHLPDANVDSSSNRKVVTENQFANQQNNPISANTSTDASQSSTGNQSQKTTVVNQFANAPQTNSQDPAAIRASQQNFASPPTDSIAVQPKSTFSPGTVQSHTDNFDNAQKQNAIDTLLGTKEEKRVVNSHANQAIANKHTQRENTQALANAQYSLGDKDENKLSMSDSVNSNSQTVTPKQNVNQFAGNSQRNESPQKSQVDSNLQKASHSQHAPIVEANPPQYAVGLDGYCPVQLMLAQKWVKGNERWGVIHREKTYLFSSVEALNIFMKDPDKYSPVLAGFDPVVFFHQGKLKPGSRKFGAFHVLDGENSSFVLCASDANRTAFKADPEKYLNAVIQAMREVDAKAGKSDK